MKSHTLSLIRGLNRILGIYRDCPRLLRGAEVGVFRGQNSKELLKHYPQLQLTMIDSGWGNEFRNKFEPCEVEKEAREKVAFAEGRYSIITTPSPQCAADFEDESFDFVFIDADHTYDAVKADIAAWWPKVRPNGVLAGHDYRSLMDRKGKFGVSQAVDEFVDEKRLSVEVHRGFVWIIQKHDTLSVV